MLSRSCVAQAKGRTSTNKGGGRGGKRLLHKHIWLPTHVGQRCRAELQLEEACPLSQLGVTYPGCSERLLPIIMPHRVAAGGILTRVAAGTILPMSGRVAHTEGPDSSGPSLLSKAATLPGR
eukprot:1157503-Pelagomonas_calceolata.AAC.3